MASISKQFEKECYDVLNGMFGVNLEEQGICYRYEGGRACPDYVGSYRTETKFVIDCKHYEPQRYIDTTDRSKLDRDVQVVQQCLGWGRDDVRKIFVTTEGNGGPAKEEGFHVIEVGKFGAPY